MTTTVPNGGREETGDRQEGLNDFLALAHAHEWSSFYDSFDKLVQDNVARSRDLLQKAMDLPAIADREVAQVREELEGRLAAERDAHAQALAAERENHRAAMAAEHDRQRQALETLQRDVISSRALAERLATDVTAMIERLDAIATRVEDTTQQISSPDASATAGPSAPVEATADDLRWQEDDVAPGPTESIEVEA